MHRDHQRARVAGPQLGDPVLSLADGRLSLGGDQQHIGERRPPARGRELHPQMLVHDLGARFRVLQHASDAARRPLPLGLLGHHQCQRGHDTTLPGSS
ncbi:hypothetical protein [Streptomyces bingchenggensis]|uniref:hypothetical protein n=1 Tax=Streptomyces bingchenggensis TaxID=379067 RepID=UPI0005BC5201|nr:hypothetical protein [Streptomyces bingchenggensis]